MMTSPTTALSKDYVEQAVSKKEQNIPNTLPEIAALVRGAIEKTVPEETVVRWLKAVKKFGMQDHELALYTQALTSSGKVMNWGNRPAAGKHAPGGVGENTSGPVDAIVAACGVFAPIYTGQRLWHTPGTVDRFDSIPGFNIFLEADQFRNQIEKIGMAMTGQTAECAPGDGVLYALRERHSKGKGPEENLVQCEEHILASILSKKLASGARIFGLLMTYGDGAILADKQAANQMASRMKSVAEKAGARISATFLSMHAPLGDYISTTSLAIQEGIKLLRNENVSPDLRKAVISVAASMLYDAGKADSLKNAHKLATETLESGAALNKFREFIKEHGGDPDICDNFNLLPQPEITLELLANKSGYVLPSTKRLGQIANELAGDFRTPNFDPSAGIIINPAARYGCYVQKGDLLATIHGDNRAIDLLEAVANEGLIVVDQKPEDIERFS